MGGFVIHVDEPFKPAASSANPATTPAPAPAPASLSQISENSFTSAASELAPRGTSWTQMPVERVTQKENTLQPTQWTGVQVKQEITSRGNNDSNIFFLFLR